LRRDTFLGQVKQDLSKERAGLVHIAFVIDKNSSGLLEKTGKRRNRGVKKSKGTLGDLEDSGGSRHDQAERKWSSDAQKKSRSSADAKVSMLGE